MADLLLTIHCAACDADAVVRALRARAASPIHVREELVRGRDYGDASIAEQVSGLLRRTALSLLVDAALLDALVAAAAGARRERPIRWHAVAVAGQGRFE